MKDVPRNAASGDDAVETDVCLSESVRRFSNPRCHTADISAVDLALGISACLSYTERIPSRWCDQSQGLISVSALKCPQKKTDTRTCLTTLVINPRWQHRHDLSLKGGTWRQILQWGGGVEQVGHTVAVEPLAMCACASTWELYSAWRHGGSGAVIPNQLVLTSVKLLIFSRRRRPSNWIRPLCRPQLTESVSLCHAAGSSLRRVYWTCPSWRHGL